MKKMDAINWIGTILLLLFTMSRQYVISLKNLIQKGYYFRKRMINVLEKLTKEQEKIMHETRQEWLDYAFDWKKCGFDEKKAKEGVAWLYDLAKLKQPKQIYVVESPLAAEILLNEFSSVGNQVWNQVGDQIWNQVRDQVCNQVRDHVSDQVWNQVMNQVRVRVWNQVGDQVRIRVRNQVMNQVRDQKNKKFYEFGYVNFFDYGWISFYSFFEKIGLLKNEKFETYQSLIQNKVWDVILLSEVAVIIKAPIKTFFENERLHAMKEGAVIWGDGYQNYFLKGISFKKELFEKIRDNTITTKEILSLENVEQKRIIIETIGWAKILQETKCKTIDKNGEYELLECDLKDDENNKARFIKTICPSTKREYVLRVDPKIDNVLEAVAWTFEETKESYQLEKET